MPASRTRLLEAGADPTSMRAMATGARRFLDAAEGGNVAVVDALHAAGAEVARSTPMAGRDSRCTRRLPSTAAAGEALMLGADPLYRGCRRAHAGRHRDGGGPLVAGFGPRSRKPALPVSVDGRWRRRRRTARPPSLRDGLVERRRTGVGDAARLLGPLCGRNERRTAAANCGSRRRCRRQWLLAHGADAETRDADADVPVRTGSRRPEAQRCCTLFRSRAVAGRTAAVSRFRAACAEGEHADPRAQQFALELLLDRGADPFGNSDAGDPPLALAVRLAGPAAARLVAIGVDLMRAMRGMARLHLAAALGRESMLKRLSPPARARHPRRGWQTPLGVALAGGRRDLADWLDWRGWPLPRRPLLRAEDLPAAAIVGDTDAVRRLLELGRHRHRRRAGLHRAAARGRRRPSRRHRVAAARGANPQLAANTGATPLSAAVSMRHVEVVERLLGAGASLEQRLPGEVTVLMLASALGLPDVRAPARGRRRRARRRRAGPDPLHCAAL